MKAAKVLTKEIVFVTAKVRTAGAMLAKKDFYKLPAPTNQNLKKGKQDV